MATPPILKHFQDAYGSNNAETLSKVFAKVVKRFKGTGEQGYTNNVTREYVEAYFKKFTDQREYQRIEYDEETLETAEDGSISIEAEFVFKNHGDTEETRKKIRLKDIQVDSEGKISDFWSEPR